MIRSSSGRETSNYYYFFFVDKNETIKIQMYFLGWEPIRYETNSTRNLKNHFANIYDTIVKLNPLCKKTFIELQRKSNYRKSPLNKPNLLEYYSEKNSCR